MLSEKPSMSITQKAGRIDSGSAMAAMIVARRSRRNRNTTMTASAGAFVQRAAAPSGSCRACSSPNCRSASSRRRGLPP